MILTYIFGITLRQIKSHFYLETICISLLYSVSINNFVAIFITFSDHWSSFTCKSKDLGISIWFLLFILMNSYLYYFCKKKPKQLFISTELRLYSYYKTAFCSLGFYIFLIPYFSFLPPPIFSDVLECY